MTMYALMMICIGLCTNYPPSEGMLLFTAKADCEATGEKMDGVKVVKEGWKEIGHLKHHCGTIYFADYAQTERLTDGRVTCSYRTMMSEDVMARRIDPYPSQYCHEKKKVVGGKP